jgi:ubiquinone/menaquinone biosynthesis C-methylase UbiE
VRHAKTELDLTINIAMNKEKDKDRICPVEKAGGLDNKIRRLLQNPQKILKPYINKGMTVLDLGCGPGFFSIEIANLLFDTGKVIAADLQEGMLDRVRKKINGTELEQRITLHKCQEESIDLDQKVDFVLAFYMVHEVPNQDKLFKELKSILKPNGQIFIIEPKFHVSKKSFDSMIDRIISIGLEIKDSPKVFFSRTIVLENKE